MTNEKDRRQVISAALDRVLPEAGFEGLFEDVFVEVLTLVADAWMDGYDAGHEHARAVNDEWPDAPRNPFIPPAEETR